ncbi:CHAD domain-containing protein [Comamonadaceae bacterium G21597-S1]|nr:CHAD domain-containing protein [Comamonadaceae bacterium G21597-S1]
MPSPTETELKLALPIDDPADLVQRLSSTAVLRRRKPLEQALHSIYFDTPGHDLRQAQAALRIRRVDSGAAPRWLQTLKTGAPGSSALSRRGEWEVPVDGPALEPGALDAAAWSRIDPDGAWIGALEPCFATTFTRTIWLLRRRDGSVIEVALDLGSVSHAGRSAPICELELERKAGPVSALFDVAQQIARSVAVLPSATSKAQRGYALAAGTIDAPTKAAAPRLSSRMGLREAAHQVMSEMFGHFTANLNALLGSDDPEVVHQARVAWRRMRSAARLFRSVLPADGRPDWSAIEPLRVSLGELRDLDVARTETLPALREDFVGGDTDRAQAWEAMEHRLAQASASQRAAVRHRLQDPAVGQCLLQATRWLETPVEGPARTDEPPLREWAARRATRLHKRLVRERKAADDPQALHRVRLLAKRTRYSLEALRGVLPRRMVRTWYAQAIALQRDIGSRRDLAQAIVLLERLDARADLSAFVRGVATGQAMH